MDVTNYIGGGYERTSAEGNLCEWYDGDEDAHGNGEYFGIPLALEDVGSDGLADGVAEHEDSNHCKT